MPRPKNTSLRNFILKHLPSHAADIASFAAKEMSVSRASANGYLRSLVKEGVIEEQGRTKAKKYTPRVLQHHRVTVAIKPGLQEDTVLREQLLPQIRQLPKNIVDICEYGFGEMMNNVIDHSESEDCIIDIKRTYAKIEITLRDHGVGIFDKITKECRLNDKHEAILELSKGKLTTDASKHTGEGIFFTSRMFDEFAIISGDLCFTRRKQDGEDWLVETKESREHQKGTGIIMDISTDASQTPKEIFEKFIDDDYRFSRTHVSLILAKYEGENLVSRSQARRILARVERFSEVVLDFAEINEIGQAFADEIFRVWAREHPQVKLYPINMVSDVEKMIRHAFANAAESGTGSPEQASLPFDDLPKKPMSET